MSADQDQPGPRDRLSPGKLKKRLSRTVRETAQQSKAAWVSIVVMGVMIFLGYLFLDSGTRGHFTWRLRIFSVAAFVGICILLLAARPGF